MDAFAGGVAVLIGLVWAAHILADALEDATGEISQRLDLLLAPDED